MNLEKFRKYLGSTKGVVAYVALDKNGKTLTQNKGVLSDTFNNVEFSTWVMNYFHAIDTYYPESGSSLLRYGALNLFLRRDQQTIFAVVLNHETNITEFQQGFEALCQKGGAAAAMEASGDMEAKTQKGETVFLKISDTTTGTTATPVPVRKSVTASPVKRKSGSPLPLVIAVVVILAAIGAYFAVSAGKDTPADDTTTVADADVPVDYAAVATDHREQLAALEPRMETARLDSPTIAQVYTSVAPLITEANTEFKAGNYEAAASDYAEINRRYGEALLGKKQAMLDAALEANSLTHLANDESGILSNIYLERKAATELASEGDYLQALDKLDALIDAVPSYRETALDQLATLANESAERGNVDNAVFFYRQIHAIDADEPEARAYLYQNLFEPGETIDNSLGMSFAYIPPGTFTMGSSDADAFAEGDEIPHEVTLTRGFYMSVNEVTQKQWRDVMVTPVELYMERENPAFVGNTLPAHSISWQQAVQFCERLSERDGVTYRLPTEAEWEYACRAGTDTPFNNGKTTISFRDANIFNPTTPENVPMPVGTSEDTNAWNLNDMHGNVREWIADWWAPYPEGSATNPSGPDDVATDIDVSNKVVRGGSYNDDFQQARSSNRMEKNPAVGNNYLGFRIVREIDSFDK